YFRGYFARARCGARREMRDEEPSAHPGEELLPALAPICEPQTDGAGGWAIPIGIAAHGSEILLPSRIIARVDEDTRGQAVLDESPRSDPAPFTIDGGGEAQIENVEARFGGEPQPHGIEGRKPVSLDEVRENTPNPGRRRPR